MINESLSHITETSEENIKRDNQKYIAINKNSCDIALKTDLTRKMVNNISFHLNTPASMLCCLFLNNFCSNTFNKKLNLCL